MSDRTEPPVLAYERPHDFRGDRLLARALGLAGFLSSLFAGIIAYVVYVVVRIYDLPVVFALVPLALCVLGGAYARWGLRWPGILGGVAIGLGVVAVLVVAWLALLEWLAPGPF